MAVRTARKPKAKKPACQVEAYASAVVAGEIVAGRLVRLACQRHLDDLEHAEERGLEWDAEAAAEAIGFFPLLKLASGKPFELEPFQAFIVGSVAGWKKDGRRRYRVAYIEMGKGSGKSPLAAGLGLYGMIADGEPDAEVYAAATQLKQAGVVFRHAKALARSLVRASPAIRARMEILTENISYGESFFRPISSEKRGLDGLSVHMAIVDELHEHPTSDVVDKLRAGTKTRENALIFEITNAGHDRTTVCWNHHEYSIKVLEGTLQNDEWFAYVCTLDACDTCRASGHHQPTHGCLQCDQWTDEAVWIKANPGLDRILKRQYLRGQVTEAQGMPTKLGRVLRLNFCIWVEGDSKAICMDQWRACSAAKDPIAWRAEMLARLRRRTCWGGIDLSAIRDLTSLGLIFPPAPPEWPKWVWLAFYWVPDLSVRDRSELDRIPYDLWVRQEFIKVTPGNVTDYEVIRADVRGLAKEFAIREIAVDMAFQGLQLCTQFAADGMEVCKFGQGFFSMAAPVKRMLELVGRGDIDHGNNPVLAWNASNAVTKEDEAGSLKFDKKRSAEKIDGLVAGTMGLGRAMLTQTSAPGTFYETNKLEVLSW